MKLILLIYVLYLNNYSHCAEIRVDPLVLTSQGLIRGERAVNGDYSTFLGIPYGQVDLDNPFGQATPHPGFGNEVFRASDGSSACPQTYNGNNVGSLDCLKLNIYVPTKATSRTPMPVFVWIHGGGFIFGSGSEEIGINIVKNDIIFVSINYRLGPYGFLCLDDPSIPGNQGLKDQLMALRWIKENIASFGGNPYNITAGGHSAGSISVAFHLFSSQEKLFNKAILQSGIPFDNADNYNGDKEAAIKLARHLGYATSDTKQAITFLAQTSPGLVTAAAVDLRMMLYVCKENDYEGVEKFDVQKLSDLTNPRKIKNTPVLIGATSNEVFGANSNLDLKIKEILNFSLGVEGDDLDKAATIVSHFYFGDNDSLTDDNHNLDYLLADLMINHPVEIAISKLVDENAAAVYQYVFNYASENDAYNKDQVPHGAEIKYLYSDTSNFNDEETLVSDRLLSLWSNFIKSGNPTPTTSELVPLKWEPVKKNSRPYVLIDSNLNLGHRFRKESMAFWDIFYTAFESK